MTTLPFDPDAPAQPDSGIFGLNFSPEESRVILLPVPFEATTSYGGGTADGPQAILSASRQVDLFDIETGFPYRQGIALLEEPGEVREWNDQAKALATALIEQGGNLSSEEDRRALDEVNRLCGEMNRWVYQNARAFLERGKLLGIVGGDHSVPFGSIQAHAERYPRFGVLHLDAHADLRQAYEGFTWSHASIMYNVIQNIPQVERLVQVGIRDLGEAEHDMIEASEGRIVTFYDAHLSQKRFDGVPWNRQVDEIVSHLPEQVYLSFDIDGLDPALCPHTGTPVPGGLSFQEVCALLSGVVRSGRTIIGLDLVEVAPDPNPTPGAAGEWDGNVGARLLYKMIGFMLKSQERR